MITAKEIQDEEKEKVWQHGDLIELMKCKTCSSLMEKDGKYYCKQKEEEVELTDHCSLWDEEINEDKVREIETKIRQKERKEERRILLQQFLELTTTENKNWSEATELLVNYIKERYYIYTTKNDQKTEMWIYKKGIYVPEGKSKVKSILRIILKRWYTLFVYGRVMAKLEPDTFIDEEKFFNQNDINEIPLRNGILNIQTKELTSFTPKKVFFNKLNAKYDPTAECPKIDKFLRDVLTEEEDIKIMYEIIGYCLLKENRFEKAFMFLGEGRNGKDKTIELIKRLLGIDSCASVTLSRLERDGFALSECFGKMVNLASEISNQDLKDTSRFKAMTGRSVVAGQRKFLTTINFVNYAKFIFACNELPMVYEHTRAFWDRWLLLDFPYFFVPEEELDQENWKLKLKDETIIERITTPVELNGLLNKALDGLDRLLKNKRFSSTKGSKEIKELWIRKANSFMAFCLDKLKESYNNYIPKRDIRKSYNKYCKQHKVKGTSDKNIKATLQDLFGVSEERKNIPLTLEQEWCWIGITFKEVNK